MNYLLDTNVLSEWVKPNPHPGVVSWLANADEDRVFISVITLAELRNGIERLSLGRRRERLEEWLKGELAMRFEGRILSINEEVADAWGHLMAESLARGEPMGIMDTFIAASALVYDMALLTRNASDFRHSVKTVLNPWEISL